MIIRVISVIRVLLFSYSKGLKMKNKIFYIVVIIILLSVFFSLYSPIKNSFLKVESKTDSTYSIGKIHQFYKKGKNSIITNTKTFHAKTKITLPVKDSVYTYTKSDSLYKLSVNVKRSDDGKLSLEYFLDLTSQTSVRIDTIYQLRVDTIKIKQTIIQTIKPPFYNTFLFGAIIATAVILLILHFTP